MSAGRDAILGAIRRSLKRGPDDRTASGHPRGLVPARAQIPPGAQVDLFVTQATEQSATVDRVADRESVPEAVVAYLKAENLPAAVRMAPEPALEALPWDGQALLEVARGPAVERDQVSVTAALAAVAETGTLVLQSAATAPTTLNFLPETHIVVLEAAAVVGAYEEVWDRLRTAAGPAPLPRTVNLITGPSRSADIEQTLQLGAHGPRRLHVILVDHGEASDQRR
jgi:L-lactate dehydrogenase complex protein LldG